MDFSLTDDQVALQELARRISADRSPLAAEPPPRAQDGFDAAVWRSLADADLLGVALPSEHGGLGLGMIELSLVLEEAGRALVQAPLVPSLVSVGLPVATFGTARQQADLLPGLNAGELLLTAALAEPTTHDPLTLSTLARPADGGWELTGTKSTVAVADRAHRILVPAALDDGRVLLALVSPQAPGVTVEPQRTTDDDPLFLVELDRVVVSDEDALGSPDAGSEALRWIVERTRLGLAALALGMAEQQLDLAAAYTSQREQFGRPIATFQGVACRVADAFIDTRAMRGTLWQALWLLDNGRDAELESSVAQFWAAEAVERVATQAVYLHGGFGVDTDNPLHHWFLASKVVELQLGGASWQLSRLGRQLAEGATPSMA